MAVNFVLTHLAEVNQLIDISGRSQFMGRLSAGSSDISLVPLLQAYANANLKPTDRKPVEQAIDRIQFESGKLPRERAELAAWLKGHPA